MAERPTKEPPNETTGRGQTAGWILLALGFLSWSGTLLVERGFVHGAFQGATIMAMVLAAG